MDKKKLARKAEALRQLRLKHVEAICWAGMNTYVHCPYIPLIVTPPLSITLPRLLAAPATRREDD